MMGKYNKLGYKWQGETYYLPEEVYCLLLNGCVSISAEGQVVSSISQFYALLAREERDVKALCECY